MSQKDLFEKAAECARMIEATSDPEKREILTHLQALWTDLANESQFLGGDKLADQIAGLSRIHADLIQAAAERGRSSSTNKVTSNPIPPLTP
jgi:hypothetical protein